jgi:hypothetical protein
MSEWNKLKNLSPKQMEEAIAKAITELTGIPYDCNISNITYEVIEGAKFDVSLSLKDSSRHKL